jgi:hypothetical protein
MVAVDRNTDAVKPGAVANDADGEAGETGRFMPELSDVILDMMDMTIPCLVQTE